MSEREQRQSDQGPRKPADAQRDLAGLLGGLLGGQVPQGGADVGSQGQNLPVDNEVANVLGGLLGGSQAGSPPSSGHSQSPGASGIPPQSQSGASGADLGSLLGGLLGGGMTGAPVPQQQDPYASQENAGYGTSGAGGMGGLEGVLGGLLGGGGGGALGGLLGSVIGNDQASGSVAQQTGLAPSLVQALLPMIIGMLMRGGQRSSMRSQGIDIDGDGIPDNGDQLASVAQRVEAGELVDEQELRASGVTRALAQHSGYSEPEVASATVRILEALH